MLQTDWGRKTTIKRTAEKSLKPIPNRPPLAARAKTWTIFVKRMRQHVCIDVLSQNRRQALVTKILLWSRNQSRGCQINQIRKEPCHDLLTKNIFSSRKALHPSKRFRIRWLDGEQTAVGGAFNFRQEIFQRATVFPIRCTLQWTSPILNFRTEQFR